MGQMTTYVDHVELEKGNSKIQTHMINNDTTSNRINSNLEELKSSICINGKNPSNKGEEVSKAMQNLKNNNSTTIEVFKHVIEMYFKSKGNSVTLIRNEVEKL